MAHVRRRKPNPTEGRKAQPWIATYTDPTGRRRAKSFVRKNDADKWLATRETAKLRGEWVDPNLGKTRYEDWAGRWVATTVHLKPKTQAGYVSLLRTHIVPTFGSMQLAQIEPLMIQEWVADLLGDGLSAARVRQAYQVLAASLKSAVQSGYLARSPTIGIRLPRVPRREMRFLTPAEVSRLASLIAEPYEALVYVLAYGGLRWGEAAALRRGRCQLLRARLQIMESVAEVGGKFHFGPTKTYQQRSVAIPGFLRDLLAQHLAGSSDPSQEALVSSPPGGGPLRHSNFRQRIWIPALKAAKVPLGLRIHDLRHTCAAIPIAQGEHPKMIQHHLGHSSITVTLDRYGHLFPSDVDAMAERLDRTFLSSQSDQRATRRRPELIPFPLNGQKRPFDQGFQGWSGEDSNLRPADYESADPAFATSENRRERGSDVRFCCRSPWVISGRFPCTRGPNAAPRRSRSPSVSGQRHLDGVFPSAVSAGRQGSAVAHRATLLGVRDRNSTSARGHSRPLRSQSQGACPSQ